MSSKGTHAALKLRHMSSGKRTNLPVVVKSYTQTAKPSFNFTSVYGRPDPIVTYQNTKRTFQCTMHTCPFTEKNKIPTADLPNFVAAGGATEWNKSVAASLGAVYQMMYAQLEYNKEGGVPVYLIKGPPLLEITIAGILNPGAGQASIIFVPETFQVIKLADTNNLNIVMTGPEDLKFLVPADGYSFQLGGTILHQNVPPGFLEQDGAGIQFNDQTFPFGVAASFEG